MAFSHSTYAKIFFNTLNTISQGNLNKINTNLSGVNDSVGLAIKLANHHLRTNKSNKLSFLDKLSSGTKTNKCSLYHATLNSAYYILSNNPNTLKKLKKAFTKFPGNLKFVKDNFTAFYNYLDDDVNLTCLATTNIAELRIINKDSPINNNNNNNNNSLVIHRPNLRKTVVFNSSNVNGTLSFQDAIQKAIEVSNNITQSTRRFDNYLDQFRLPSQNNSITFNNNNNNSLFDDLSSRHDELLLTSNIIINNSTDVSSSSSSNKRSIVSPSSSSKKLKTIDNCPICLDVPNDPFQLDCCNKPICWDCLMGLLAFDGEKDKDSICPLCREPLDLN